MRRLLAAFVALLGGLLVALPLHAQERLRPYVLAYERAGTVSGELPRVRQALTGAGFRIVGEYSPYEGARVIAFTGDALLATASRTEFGGYAAALRVGLAEVDGKVQVSYNNPKYLALAYRLDGDLADVASALADALGAERTFGSKKGLKAKKLRKYHYMIAMPYFDDQLELASHGSQEAAVKAVEAGLAAGAGGTAKVYRVDLPGGKAVLFGVALREGKGSDRTVMSVTDRAPLRHIPHLPYEILVTGGKAYALHGKFRIALSFPDLGMGTFMKISSAPKAIEKALRAAAGG